MATTVTVTGNGTSGPFSVSAIDWHPYGLLQQQSIVFRLDSSQSATLLTYGDDYIFDQEAQSITLVGDTLSSLESLRVTRETPDAFFASLPDLGVADAISTKSNDLQVMNRLNEVEADLAQVSGEVSLTYEGDAFTSVSAGSNITMAVTSGDLLISSSGGSGPGGAAGFTDAQFDYGKPAQSVGTSPILQLTHDATGFFGSTELDLYVIDNELADETFVNAAIETARNGSIKSDRDGALTAYTVKTLSNNDGKIGITNNSGDVELSYTGPAPAAAPTGTMTMWCGSSAPADVPDGWAVCDGSSIDSTSDTSFAALFAVIGTAFGGSGAASFNLPDMRGNVPVGVNGLSPELGSAGGNAQITLARNEIPKHSHEAGTLQAQEHKHYVASSTRSDSNALGDFPSQTLSSKNLASSGNPFIYSLTPTTDVADAGKTSNPIPDGTKVASDGDVDVLGKTSNDIYSSTSDNTPEGTQQPISLMQPYVGVHYIIKK